MSYNDKKWGFTLPTRHGTPQGGGTERQMLDRIGGADGYRKSYQTNADGSVTRLETRNGRPFFITEGGKLTTTTLTYGYLESGQFTWSGTGELNPQRGDPATWYIGGAVAPSVSYIGWIKDAAGTQDNYPTLTTTQESQAMGYPKTKLKATSTVEEIAAALAADATTKTQYESSIVLRKMVTGYFSPTVFSGKMKLFMQALYGSHSSHTFPLSLEVSGESVLLWYNYKDLKVQFGFWPHSDQGIFTDNYGGLWLIKITNGCTCIAYPIEPDVSLKDLVARYVAGVSDGEATEIEAYIFANSVIRLDKAQVIGSYTITSASPGVVPAGGAPMAYAWKWNKKGDKARIVLHAYYETSPGSQATAKWRSTTVTLSFTCSEGGIFSMSGSQTNNGDWMDGWGVYCFWVPGEVYESAPLYSWNLCRFPRPNFAFTKVEIYGYFDQTDQWISVLATRKTDDVMPATRCRVSPNTWLNGYTPDADGFFLNDWPFYMAVPADESNWVETYAVGTTHSRFTIEIGTQVYAGSYLNGAITRFERNVGGSKALVDDGGQGVGFLPNCVPTNAIGGPPLDNEPTSGIIAYLIDGGHNYQEMTWTVLRSRTVTTSSGQSWTFVIPAGDAECVFISTRTKAPSGSYTTNWSGDEGYGSTRFYGNTIDYFSSPGVPYSHRVWCAATQIGGFYGNPASTYFSGRPHVDDPDIIDCYYHHKFGKTKATPAGSYEMLFTCDKDFPYYSRGIDFYSSYGGQYYGSENINFSIRGFGMFVGWA
jgi:hypothetical protein